VENTVGQMEAVTQKNAQLVEESSAALTSVDQQAEELATLVKFFSIGTDIRTSEGLAGEAVAFRKAASRPAGAGSGDALRIQRNPGAAMGGN